MSEDVTSSVSRKKEGHLTGARVGFNFESSVFFYKTSSPLSFDKENVNPSATNDKKEQREIVRSGKNIRGRFVKVRCYFHYEEAGTLKSSWPWSSSSRGDEIIDYDPDGPDSECDWNDEDEWSF